MRFSIITVLVSTTSYALAATTSYSLYTTVITYETTLYSTFTSVSCPPAMSTSVVSSGDTISSIFYLNTCNPDYTVYTQATETDVVTNTAVVTSTSLEAAIPSDEIDWD